MLFLSGNGEEKTWLIPIGEWLNERAISRLVSVELQRG